MVQNKRKETVRKEDVNGGGLVTILVATYKRPKLLKQCLEALKKSTKIGYYLWIYDNSIKNIGLNAYSKMAKKVKTDYILTLDEDVIWFSDGWLEKLLDAHNDAPLTKSTKERAETWQPPGWGWLGVDVIRDRFTNGGFWPEFLEGTKVIDNGKYRFRWGKTIPQTCALIRRELLEAIGGFPTNKKPFFNFDGQVGYRVDRLEFPQGILLDAKIYHACGPYYNQKYEKIWKEKNEGQTIAEAKRLYQEKDSSLRFEPIG